MAGRTDIRGSGYIARTRYPSGAEGVVEPSASRRHLGCQSRLGGAIILALNCALGEPR